MIPIIGIIMFVDYSVYHDVSESGSSGFNYYHGIKFYRT